MDDVKQAIDILKNGGIVIFPTDTAFGIGCRIDNEEAVKRLFAIRKRAETKAVPVLVSSLHMAQEYVQVVPDAVVEKLVKPFWPGALTIVLKSKADKIARLVRGGGDTVGVRVPDHLTTLALINGVGVPIVGTSANFAGEETPYAFESLNEDLTRQVDFVVHGQCHNRQASTVIDCTETPWKVLRKGAVKIENI
jgi:L-threonylcarbamoyladenylate synthase